MQNERVQRRNLSRRYIPLPDAWTVPQSVAKLGPKSDYFGHEN